MSINVDKLSRMAPPQGLPFHIGKLGHVVLQANPTPCQRLRYLG